MPFYHRVYTPGELQFITASTYGRTPLFLSDPEIADFKEQKSAPAGVRLIATEETRTARSAVRATHSRAGSHDTVWVSWVLFDLHTVAECLIPTDYVLLPELYRG